MHRQILGNLSRLMFSEVLGGKGKTRTEKPTERNRRIIFVSLICNMTLYTNLIITSTLNSKHSRESNYYDSH